MNARVFNNYLSKLDILSYYKEKGDEINWARIKTNISKSSNR
jgi:hypothetical protein